MIVVRDSVGTAELGSIVVRDTGGLANIGEAVVRDGAGAQVVFSPSSGMSVSVTPDVYGSAASPTGVAITTSSASVTVSGGTAPFSYLWERTDAEGGTWQILSPTSATTQFRRLLVPPTADAYPATFACTVTDSTGQTAVTSDVDASVINYSSGGGI